VDTAVVTEERDAVSGGTTDVLVSCELGRGGACGGD